jgi:hypothetical protein
LALLVAFDSIRFHCALMSPVFARAIGVRGGSRRGFLCELFRRVF